MTAFVQQNTVHTTTSAPATITASLSGPSTAGNLLLMWVCVNSSAANAAIATPAGWTLIASQSFSAGNRLINLYALPNCTVLTTVVVTITTTTGSAVATMLEFSGIGTAPPTEFTASNSGVSDAATLPLARLYPVPATVGAIQLHAWGYNSSLTVVSANSQGFSAAQTDVATGATANAGLSSWFLILSGPGNMQNGGTLQTGNAFAEIVARIGGNGGPIGYAAGGAVDMQAGNGSPNMFGGWSAG